MNPDQYNHRELVAHRIGPGHVTEMTRLAQAELGLVVDGECGPATRAALDARRAPVVLETGTTGEALGLVAVQVGISLLGRGEEGSNNHGPLITELGGEQGWEWCALTAGFCWRSAYQRAGLEPLGWCWRRPGVPEPGALALLHAAAAAGGGVLAEPLHAKPGDLVGWDWGGGHGHVGLVERVDGGLLRTIEGNVGRFPAKVRRMAHDPGKEPHLWGVARPYQ